MKKILLALLVALTLSVNMGGMAYAAIAPEPPPPPPPTVTTDYPINLSPLPDVTADYTRIQAILAVIFTILGGLSLLMFTIGGLRYISSQGDPQATAKAKGTLIYALVGLIVSISAIAIVTFVIGSI